MAATQLERTNGTPTLTTKCTISVWIKRNGTSIGDSAKDEIIAETYTNDTNFCFLRLDGADTLNIYGTGITSVSLSAPGVLRDPNAWYHIVAALDSTESANADKVKLYINGIQQTLSGSTFPSSAIGFNNSGSKFNIGKSDRYANFDFDGTMSHYHFIDGTAYPASTFGSTDSVTGQWKINTSPSVTYGDQGFFILKDGNSVTDQSGEGNNLTVSTGTLTQTEDCPSNNFATLSTIYQPKDSGNAAMTNGNLRHGGSGDYSACAGIGMKTGKYYWEVKIAAGGNQRNIGIVRADKIHSNTTYGFYLAQGGAGSLTTEYSAGYRGSDGDFVVKSTGSQTVTSASTTITTGDIVGVAVDCDNYTIQFFKNGVSMQTLNLTSAFFDVEQLPADRTDDTTYFEYNFGNGYFGTTAISSEGTNASGIGKFEYDVPTGYTALSTKGLNE